MNLERAENNEKTLRELNSSLDSLLKESRSNCEKLQQNLIEEQRLHEERIVSLQIQVSAYRSKLDKKENEITDLKRVVDEVTAQSLDLRFQLEEKVANNIQLEDSIKALTKQFENQEILSQKLRDKIKEYERNSGASAVLKAEQELVVKSLRMDLKASYDKQAELTQRIAALSERESLVAKLEETVSALSHSISNLQTDLDTRDALITRLRQETGTLEKSHAVRTAMLAAAEEESEALRNVIVQHEGSLKQMYQRELELQVREISILFDHNKFKSHSRKICRKRVRRRRSVRRLFC